MNSIRIIGGKWRRRILRFPASEGLRPTPDRVRETLFNWLGQDLSGLSCLDLFAGSGALGFEAASRGAARVVMAENAPAALLALEKNIQLLDASDQVEIVRTDAVRFVSALRKTGRRFDVLFLDPPYRQGWLDRLSPLLPEIVVKEGTLYVEAEGPVHECGDWRTIRSGRAGQAYYHLMRRGESYDA